MTTTSRTTPFMSSPLFIWVNSLQEEKEIKNYSELSSGSFFNQIWLQIDPQPPFPCLCSYTDDTVGRIRNLNSLLNNIKAFYDNVLGQTLVLKLPDVIKIATNPSDESSSSEEMHVLLLLLLGCAVQCEHKEHFIDGIKQLDISVQHSIVECIQQITDNPESVWLNSEWNALPEEEQERQRLYEVLVQHINRLVKERDELFHRVIELSTELDTICSTVSTESSQSLFISNPDLTNNDQKSHLLVELADVRSKLRKVHQELEEKNEIVSELKEILEQNKESCNKLRHDNLELIQEARSAKAYRDEIDVLNERVRKVDRLENEVQRYRDRMNELEFYKSRVEELREDNRILSETKVMLEDQLEGSRKRADHMPELETQILKLNAYTNELSIQKDLDRNKIETLIEEITHLRLDKKSSADQLTKVESELSHMKCQMKMDSLHHNKEGNLYEQMNNDASKRVLKLELENQRLQSLVENFKNNRTCDTTAPFINNNHNNFNNRFNVNDIPNGNYTDDMLSPGDVSMTSDSTSLSLSADFNTKLEQMESENEMLRNTAERVKKAETKIWELESVRNDLQNEVKDLKSKQSLETIKYEQMDRNSSQLMTENQRLQRLLDNKSKRYEETQHEIQALDNENQKLLATAETLKASVKRLNDLERDVTNMEADNHRLEQEKKSLEKEISRLKSAIDAKDTTIDDYGTRLSTIEMENKQMKRDFEQNNAINTKLKELEKENKEISNQLFVSNKTVLTLRQDLVKEKIKTQQMCSELERVSNGLQSVCKQRNHFNKQININLDTISCNKDWNAFFDDIINDIIKKSLEQKDFKICELEDSICCLKNANSELKNAIECKSSDESTSIASSDLVCDLQRKITHFEDDNKNLKNENITQKDIFNDLLEKHKTLESNVVSISGKNNDLQSDKAKLQVENSLIKSQNSSLLSQNQNLETNMCLLQENKDKIQQKCNEIETNHKSLVNDHEALQVLHQQLTVDYENQLKNSSTLKSVYKTLKSEHKAVQDKLEAWLISQKELEQIDDTIEHKKAIHSTESNELMTKLTLLERENKSMDEEYKRLQTEYKMLQNIYKKLRTENNDLKLKHTELKGETADCRDRMSLLDVEVSKLSNYCEMVALTNNSIESHRKRLINSISNLLCQYHDLLTEIGGNSEKIISDKMHDLSAKKEKLDKMIKDYDQTLEKKKVVVNNSGVRRIHKSSTDLCLSNNQNIGSKVRSKDRNSAPIESLIDEAIYGRIWEAETPPIPSNTAILRPFRSNPSTTLSQNNDKTSESNHQLNNESIVQKKEETIKSGKNSVISPVPPPRPPPRVSTTIENKIHLSVITSPPLRSPNSTSGCEASTMIGTRINSQSSHSFNNFTRGTFKSNTINYGSPVRRQPPNKNGIHHIHHFHHMHPHSASPSLHSDSSLTPLEDSELSDSAVNNNRSVDNITVNSNTTNSVWYEYGCV